MNRTFWLVVLSFLFFSNSHAQQWEIGVFSGVSNYQGDLAPDILPKESHTAAGLVIRRNLSKNPYLAFTYSATYGKVSGKDSNFTYLRPRNLEFSSTILEGSLQAEYNFFRFETGIRPKQFTPYLATGLSMFLFNPMAKGIELVTMSTEGQEVIPGAPKLYKLYQAAIPMTGGFKWHSHKHWNINLSGSFRKTFTDYLDDVGGKYPDFALLEKKKGIESVNFSDPSVFTNKGVHLGKPGYQRGNPDTKDWYLFLGLTINYIIRDPMCAFMR